MEVFQALSAQAFPADTSLLEDIQKAVPSKFEQVFDLATRIGGESVRIEFLS